MPPLRVLLVIGGLGVGGAERQLTELASRGRELGIEFCVVALGGTDDPYGGRIRAAGVPVIHLTRSGSFDLTRVLALAWEIRRFAPAVVHSFLIDANPYAWLAATLARAGAIVVSNRNTGFDRDAIRRRIDSLVFARADAIVVNAEAVRHFTSTTFDIDASSIEVIQNGVDTSRFRPRARGPASPLRVGTIGALEAKKNPRLFARVARLVQARRPGVVFQHLGDGPLRAAIDVPGETAVEYLGVSRDPERFLATLDVFVLASDREGLPNVVLEAMATGLPVVATRAGGVEEILEEGVTGYLAPIGNAQSIAGHVSDLLGDAATRRRMGAEARTRVERLHSADRMARALADLYGTIASRSRHRNSA